MPGLLHIVATLKVGHICYIPYKSIQLGSTKFFIAVTQNVNLFVYAYLSFVCAHLPCRLKTYIKVSA